MPNDPAVFHPQPPFPLATADAFADPEKLLAAYFHSETVGLAIIDSEFRYLAVNEKLAQMNGVPAADHLGKTVREILRDNADRVEPALRRVLESREHFYFEVSAKLSQAPEDGHFVIHYFPINDANGEVTRIGAIILEITAQKKLEQSLQSAHTQLDTERIRRDALTDISRLLSLNRDLSKVFPHVSARVRRILRQEFASVAVHDPVSGLLVRQALDFPLGRGLTNSVPILSSNSPAGHALQAGKSMIFSPQQLKSYDTEITRRVLAEGLQTLCCVPLLRPQGPLGVFVLGSTRPDAFHATDIELLDQVAAQLALALENSRAATEIEQLKQRLSTERSFLQGEVRREGPFAGIIGDSPQLRAVLEQVATVAPSDAAVLVSGETGTGKELIARAIHELSERHHGPFIKMNCAAIPTGLLESELFGHEKGAFTGAISQKVGRMELADRGTLFLDEVGEIPLELQPKLLRVLQDQEFERLGSTRTLKVDVRIVAATNRDLARGMAAHEFRADLFYRLNVFPIHVPALRDRPEDIPLLVRYFVQKFAQRMQHKIESVPTETMDMLKRWSWPGNVRELENLMERSVIMTEGSALRVSCGDLRSTPVRESPQPDDSLNQAEREHIIRILRECNGVLSGPNGAALRLGLKRTTLQSKMQRLNINRSDYIDSRRA